MRVGGGRRRFYLCLDFPIPNYPVIISRSRIFALEPSWVNSEQGNRGVWLLDLAGRGWFYGSRREDLQDGVVVGPLRQPYSQMRILGFASIRLKSHHRRYII